jgi:signal transduction histidine kinase
VHPTAAAHRFIAARHHSGALVELGIAAVALVGTLAIQTHGLGDHRRGSGLDLPRGLFVAATVVPLVFSRRGPFPVFVLTAAVSAVAAGLGYALDIPLGATAALYLLAASRSDATWWSPPTIAVVAAFFVAYLGATAAAESRFPALELLHTGLVWAGAWFAGEWTRLHRDRLAGLQERAERVERDAERDRLLAVAEERARIARDLHDSAGHAINLIAVRAGAARLRHDRDPDRSLAALEAIEEVARETAADIDQIVHSLRDRGATDDGPVTPLGMASLDTLVAHHTQAGLTVGVRASGTARPLPRAVDQAAYRILQEALTNAARHGTGAAAVDLEYQDDALALTVVNPATNGGATGSAGGHGLIGMRERAVLLGGALEAHRESGTFRVSARIPYGTRHG